MKKFSYPSGFKYFSFFSLASAALLTAFQGAQQDRGTSPWIWVILIIAVILIVWLILRMRRSESTPTRDESASMGAKSYAAPVTPAAPDDLAIIEGIGPKIAEVLQAAGITTFNQLAATDTDRLRDILQKGGIRLADPSTWAEQARLAAAGDQAGLKALQDRLNAGRNV